METEPSKAEPPKRKRRWFQFSLRTLLIVVTLLAVACRYVGSQVKFLRDRHEARASHAIVYPEAEEGPDGIWYFRRWGLNVPMGSRPKSPWPLRWFGEEGYWGINAGETASDGEIANLKRLFPEAVVWRDQEQH
jgi:hypothetical protein